MKVLWMITNLSYKQEIPSVGGGWIGSLLEHFKLRSDIEIGLVFFSENVRELTIHKEGRTMQFVVPSFLNKREKILRNATFKDYLFNKRESMFLSVVDSFNPDIIQIFGTENPFGLLGLKLSIPIIIHIQGVLNPVVHHWFPPGYNNTVVIRYTSVLNILRMSGYWADYIRYKRMARRELKIFDITRFFSGRTSWDHRLVKLMSKSATYFHCDEVLRPAFYLEEWTPPPRLNSIKLLSIINPNIYKGIETILETANLLKGFSTHKIIWSIAGINPDNALVRMFIDRTKTKVDSIDVKFLGSLQEQAVVSEMLNSDIFVHPSHIDNSPNSLCEAMILGMPIISTNVGGIPSLIDDDVEGILVQDGEPFGLAGAILELVNDVPKGIGLGKKARERAMKRHDPIKIVSNQIQIYQSMLNSGNVV